MDASSGLAAEVRRTGVPRPRAAVGLLTRCKGASEDLIELHLTAINHRGMVARHNLETAISVRLAADTKAHPRHQMIT
jgi:hypothetical protein